MNGVLRGGLLLGVLAALGATLVAGTRLATAPRIEANRQAALRARLHEIVPAAAFDNALAEDRILVRDPLLGSDAPVSVYRARRRGAPVAAVFQVRAAGGYNGAIWLLVGIFTDGRIAGVRVLSHRETPGLGDAIERARSDWVLGFDGRALDPSGEPWRVQRDGGDFDQLSGATVTPRAVVGAVHDALLYFSRHREALFNRTAEPSS